MTMQIATRLYGSVAPSVDREAVEVAFELVQRLEAKRVRNAVRQVAYDQKTLLDDLRISLPPQLRGVLEPVLGWPAKTVDVLANRVQFERFVMPGEDADVFGLNRVAEENSFASEFGMAVTSALTHSVSFLTVSQGDVGDPDVLWMAKSAQNATGIMDARGRRLRAGLSVLSRDEAGEATSYAVYLPDRVVTFTRHKRSWLVDAVGNPTGRVLMEPLRFRPDLNRRFGRSRISRAVLAHTGSAMRTIARSEVAAEFFAYPQRYALGVEKSAFDENKWRASMSTFMTINKDEDGDLPTVGSFQQQSMLPHTEQLRQWASLLASESNIPLDELGFPSDNPSSDAAIQSQRDPLRLVAQKFIDEQLKPSLKRLGATSVMLRDGVSDVPSGFADVTPWFAPTVHISDSAAADAVLKQVSVLPWMAESPVILEKLGYSQDAIDRLLSDKRRQASGGVLDRLIAGQAASAPSEAVETPVSESAVEDASAMKAKFDALGVAIRAGVDPTDAAQRLGLSGIKFTGATPVALRLPKDEAVELEER